MLQFQREGKICFVSSLNGKKPEYHLVFTQWDKSSWIFILMSCVTPLAVQCKTVEGKESFWQSRQEYQTQRNKGIFSQLHSAAFIRRQEPASCQTPGAQNEGFPCFIIGKPSGASRYHRAAQSREDGRGPNTGCVIALLKALPCPWEACWE